MIRTGLTGNIGSGKTTVAKVFNTLGVPVFYSDAEAKKLYEKPELISEIVKIFGRKILSESGKIERSKLASEAFGNAGKLEALNLLVHKKVFLRFEDWARENNNAELIIMESALIFESPVKYKFDNIIVVDSDKDKCFERVKKRDAITTDEFEKRMSFQIDSGQKKKLADFIIYNNDEDSLIDQVIRVYNEIIQQRNFH
jgi:dephospho-CoA kinase